MAEALDVRVVPHAGVWAGLIGFAIVVLLVWIRPRLLGAAKPMPMLLFQHV